MYHFQYKKENHRKLSQICSYGIFSRGLKNEFEIAVVKSISVRATEGLLYNKSENSHQKPLKREIDLSIK